MPKVKQMSMGMNMNVGPGKLHDRFVDAVLSIKKELKEEIIKYLEDDNSDFNRFGFCRIELQWHIDVEFDETKEEKEERLTHARKELIKGREESYKKLKKKKEE